MLLIVLSVFIGVVEYSYGACPQGYVLEAGEVCLHFSEISGSWAEANSYCRTFGAILMEPRTLVLQTALASAMRNIAGDHAEFFIGGSDLLLENKWMWSTGSQPITDTHWSPGNPSNSNVGEDCMTVTKTGLWNDLACDRKFPFICERDAMASSDIIG